MKTTLLAPALLASLVTATAAFEDIPTFEEFTPTLAFASAKSTGVYDSISTSVIYHGEQLDLELHVDMELFAEDWSLETYADNGELLSVVTDPRPFLCHYRGSVVGKKNSEVVMSLCDEIGMRGVIHTPDFDIEVQPDDDKARSLNSLGNHIVYDLANVTIAPHQLDELPTPWGSASIAAEKDGGVSAQVAYTAQVTVVSDSYRMSAYSSSSAESSNTQAIIAQANNFFSRTNFGNGNTLRLSIQTQVQNPSGWSHSSNIEQKLNNLSTYKSSSWANRDNVVGLTHFSYGGTIGFAWINSMCDRYYSSGLNNVGWSSSDTSRGQLVAHEIGHNFNMQHDSSSQGGNGFVMWPSLSSGVTHFSSYSVSQFNSRRNSWSCLLEGGSSPTPGPSPTPAPPSGCGDNGRFRDENGYPCSDWTGYDCQGFVPPPPLSLSTTGRLDLLQNCRTTCSSSTDDSSYRDENGYRCSAWVGYDCARDDQMSAVGRQQLNTYCPQACGHC